MGARESRRTDKSKVQDTRLTLLAKDRHKGNELLKVDGRAELSAAVEDAASKRVHHDLWNSNKLFRSQLSVRIEVIKVKAVESEGERNVA